MHAGEEFLTWRRFTDRYSLSVLGTLVRGFADYRASFPSETRSAVPQRSHKRAVNGRDVKGRAHT